MTTRLALHSADDFTLHKHCETLYAHEKYRCDRIG